MLTRASELKRAVLPMAIASALYAHTAVAENAADTSTVLAPVAVVGQTTNVEITAEQLDFYQANDLADIFRHVPSVSVGGSLGIAQKVYIRGLEDTQLSVTVDGAPQTGTLFHHAGRLSIEPELLKKVEVQAGAGEATAGAGAIGGAIHFETKDPEDLLAPGQQFGGMVKGGVFSNEGHRESVSLYGRIGESGGFLASYMNADRDDMKDGNGDTLASTASDQDLGFLKLTSDFADHHRVELAFEKRQEEGDFAQRPNWPVASWSPEYPMESERQTITLNHAFNLNALVNLETTLYRTENSLLQDVHTRWGKFEAEVESYGFDVRNTSQLGAHEVVYGADLRRDEVKTRYHDPSQGSGNAEDGRVMGLYVQDHWQLTDALLLSYGARYDDYEVDQGSDGIKVDSNGLSPNIGFEYDINDQLQLSVGHARAMRGKEVGDGFTLGGTIDPNIDPEKVENTEVGIEYDNGDLLLKASVYHSTIDDVILDQLGAGTVYENAGTVKTRGFEVQAAYQWQQLLLSASFSHNDARLNGNRVEGYEHNGLANSRGDTLTLSALYAYSPQLRFGWNVNYVDDLNNVEVFQRASSIGWIGSTQTINKPGYTVHDIYLTWTPLADDSLELNLAVQNLFDEQYIDHSSVADYNGIAGWEGVSGQPEAGRDIRLSALYRF